MKTCAFFFLLGCFLAPNSIARIRNGYSEIAGARSSLTSIRQLLNEKRCLTYFEKQNMRFKREELERYIIHHAFTERLLDIFRAIAPELYGVIDTLKDSKERSVDVYVKFVPGKDLPPGIAGMTSLGQAKGDEHTCQSEYGPNSVSVEIAAGSKSLITLAHELGHVQYQTMNLATYFRYYAISYGDRSSTQKSLGHNDRDDSGKSAITFVGRFQEYFLRYIRFGNSKPQSYQVLLQNIEREFKIKGDI